MQKSLMRCVVLALLALSTAVPTAQAATTGQTFSYGMACSPDITWVDSTYAVPSAGTVTSFSHQSGVDYIYGGSEGARLAFKVLRPLGGSAYQVVGGTTVQTLQTSWSLETFTLDTPIDVHAGDVLGFWVSDHVLPGCMSVDGSGTVAQSSLDPAPGDTLDLSLCCFGNLNVSAEFTPSPDPQPDPDPQPEPARYTFDGFAAPVDGLAVNAVNAGRTVALKWRLTDGDGAAVADAASFAGLTSAPCDAPGNLADETAGGALAPRHLGDGSWHLGWRTSRAYAGQCRTLTLWLGDGTQRTATFQLG